MTHALAWLGGSRVVAAQAVLFVAAGAVSMLPRREDWLGSWKQALDLGAGSTVFIGPVAAGAACLVYARLRSSAASEIILQSRRDWWCWLQPLVALWVLASAALLLVTLGATTAARLSGVPAYPQYLWIVLPAVAVLAAQLSIGAAIGYGAGRPWAAPLAAVLVFVLYLWTVVGPLPEFFDTGSATASLAGLRFTVGPRVALGIAGLALAVLVLAAGHRRLFLASPSRRSVVAVAAAIWLVGWFTVGDSDERYAVIADPPLACAGSDPEVCVHEETPRPLADLAGKVDDQARALRALGVALPERFVETFALGEDAGEGSGDGVVVLLDESSRRTVSDDRATDTLVRPALCAADFGDEPPVHAFDVRRLLGRWLQVQAGLLRVDPQDPYADWFSGDADVREDWVRTTYRQLTRCELDTVRLPGESG